MNFIKKYNLFKLFLIIFNDFFLVFLSSIIFFIIRYESINYIPLILYPYLPQLIIYLIIFFIFDLNKQFHRFLNLQVIIKYIKVSLLYFFCFSIFSIFLQENLFPRSIGLIQPIIFFFILCLNRLIVFKILNFNKKSHTKNVVLFGFNKETIDFLNKNETNNNYKIQYIIDDNEEFNNRIFNNIKIKNFSALGKIVKYNSIDLFILSENNLKLRNLLIKKVEFYNIKILMISYLPDGISTSNSFFKLDLSEVSLNEILNKEIITTSSDLNFNKKTILVTGAAGSIGSELCRQLLNLNTNHLIILDHSEEGLFKINNELESLKTISNNPIKINYFLVNLKDLDILENLFENYQIDLIFHAAAYKHVTIVEKNIFSAFQNNILSTYHLSSLALKYKIEKFVLVSSDKAVRPSNYMGASKRVAELIINNFNKISIKSNFKTIYTAVRFGNVVNSSGSVIPLFLNQINKEKKITLTHPDVSRYFMTIPQAVSLVLESSVISKGGDVFLLDMGAPIKIIDIINRLVKLNGLTIKNTANPFGDIEIEIIGLRKGEKLHEELLIAKETRKTDNIHIYESLEPNMTFDQFNLFYNNLNLAINNFDKKKLLDVLKNKFVGFLE